MVYIFTAFLFYENNDYRYQYVICVIARIIPKASLQRHTFWSWVLTSSWKLLTLAGWLCLPSFAGWNINLESGKNISHGNFFSIFKTIFLFQSDLCRQAHLGFLNSEYVKIYQKKFEEKFPTKLFFSVFEKFIFSPACVYPFLFSDALCTVFMYSLLFGFGHKRAVNDNWQQKFEHHLSTERTHCQSSP